MKVDTSLSNKNDKTEDKVIFMDFPYDKKNKKEKNINKLRNIIIWFMIIIVLLILFLGSTVMNMQILENNARSNYKIINKFDSSFAKIVPEDRVSLYKDMGYSVAKVETRNRDDKNYITTYAYYKFYDDIAQADSITVYYDDKNVVDYLMVNMVYKKSDFNERDVVMDCNNILKNLVDIEITSKSITEVKNNAYYYQKEPEINASSSYSLYEINEGEHYYVLTIIIEK